MDAYQLLQQVAPYIQYQESFLQKRASLYMNYPSHIHMETLSVCNAACSFCPYPGIERKGRRMSDALIEKILGDLRDIPGQLPFLISPFKVNEPFLDHRLFDILGAINEKLPNASIALTSNASPITEEKLHRLARVRGIQYLWLSVNDHRPEHYETTMKLPFARTLERLDMIHRKVAARGVAFPVVLSRVGDGTQSDADFVRWVGQRYPLFRANVFPRGGWLGQVDLLLGPVPAVACHRWFELSITSSGVVAHCCMDGQAKWPIGDVSRQHVLEVYNSPEYRRLREQMTTRLDADPCRTCTFL
ncbi:MAG: radical SAM/SPASM domain-containing protein [Candidatus Tectomicrobia bacterium]|uniref:Radical SAM/SPASM domain-containing protein n=1 Tax=Tectimicrobiota bacterium TaxID=2528274 RepID=A0A932I2I9_UNCTE|nr:radical SAM/SPASM domain-containing protein [Candidatus Tectomicrobia bacterium]